MFNKNIHNFAVKNYHTEPVGLPSFDNPYLLKSSNQVLNEILKNKNLLDLHRPLDTSVSRSSSVQMMIGDKEDLARHVMREVYQPVGERRDMRGFVIDRNMSSPETVAYIGKDQVLLGLRGTSNLIRDGVTDTEIFLNRTTGFPFTGTLDARFDRDDLIYNKIRAKYPNKEIIMGGHSLGNSLGMNILKNHQEDRNIKFFGYNGWIHPDYNTDSRAYHTSSPGDIVSAITPTDLNLPMTDKEKFVAGGIGVAGIGTLAAREYYRKMGEQNAERIEKLRNRQNVVDEATENEGLYADADDPYEYQAEMRADVEENFPEYFNVKSVIEDLNDDRFDNLLDNMPEVYIKGSEDAEIRSQKIEELKSFIETMSDNVDGMTWNDFKGKIAEHNEYLDLVDNPEFQNATQDVIEQGLISDENYLGNVYVSQGDVGVNELLSHSGDEITDILNPLTHSEQMNQARVTTSEIMDTEGTIHMHPFEDVISGSSRDFTALGELETAAETAAVDLAVGSSMAAGGLLVASAAAGAYWLWSHGAERFKIKNNLFKTKKFRNLSK